MTLRLQGFRIQNFKLLKSVTLGRLLNQESNPLSTLTAVTGDTATGKNSVVDAFAFIQHCIKFGIVDACSSFGGIEQIKSLESDGNIQFHLCFKKYDKTVEYSFQIGSNGDFPFVEKERLYVQDNTEPNKGPSLMFRSKNGIIINKEEKMIGKDTLALSFYGMEVEYGPLNDVLTFIDGMKIISLGGRRLLQPCKQCSSFQIDEITKMPIMIRDIEKRRSLEMIHSLSPFPEKVYSETDKYGFVSVVFMIGNKTLRANQVSEGTRLSLALLLILESDDESFIVIKNIENGLGEYFLETIIQRLKENRHNQVLFTSRFSGLVEPKEEWKLTRTGFSSVAINSEEHLDRLMSSIH